MSTSNVDDNKVKLEDLNDIPVNVAGFHFEGLQKTKHDILHDALQPCLQAKTFGELTYFLSQASQNIERLDMFKEMKFVIDADQNSESSVIVNVQVKERRYKLHVGTEIQKNDIGFGAGGIFYNIFGRGERADISASLGSQSATPLSINFIKPLNSAMDRIIKISAISSLQHYIDGFRFKNRLSGLSTSYLFTSGTIGSNRLQHELKYSIDWRHIFAIDKDASLTVRRSAGHSLKSSLSFLTTYSTLNHPIFPSRGVFYRFNNEFAGLAGSVRYFKNEFASKTCIPIFGDVSVYGTVRLGHIMPVLGQGKLAIIDKFQLGGPLSVRGFALNSLGPKDRKDAVGGDLGAEAGVGITFPFSSNTKDIVRGHLFVNAGLLTNLKYDQSIKQNVQDCLSLSGSNVSVGGGLQVKIGDAKLEFNIAHPINTQKGVVFHRGIQVGIGVEFL